MRIPDQMKAILLICIWLQIPTVLFAHSAWEANWIALPESQNLTDSSFGFRQYYTVTEVPAKAIAKTDIDSKHRLWINSKLVVFESRLKRDSAPTPAYFDEYDIKAFREKGQNSIFLLIWCFGKDGFSEDSSGKAGYFIKYISPGLEILIDRTWKIKHHLGDETSTLSSQNHRLSAIDKWFDTRCANGCWQKRNLDASCWQNIRESGIQLDATWHILVLSLYSKWETPGLLSYVNKLKSQFECVGASIVYVLPSIFQISGCLKSVTPDGLPIDIRADNLFGGVNRIFGRVI